MTELGRLDKAELVLGRATQIEPEFGPAWEELAKVYSKTGKKQEAQAARGKARVLGGFEVISTQSTMVDEEPF